MKWWKKLRKGLAIMGRVISYSAEIMMWEQRLRANIAAGQNLEVTPEEQAVLLDKGKPIFDAAREFLDS